MKLTSKNKIIKCGAVFTLLVSAVATAEDTLPQNKPGYDKVKDLGVKAPKGADTLFDGTMKSIEGNWLMFFTRPIVLIFFILSFIALIFPLLKRKKNEPN